MAASPIFPAVGDNFPPPGKKRPELVFEQLGRLAKLGNVTSASRLELRPAPEMASSGVHTLDRLTGGLPRGCLTEICGSASSGRTSILFAALAASTMRQEACALVDVSDAFDPVSAAKTGMDFKRLLWVRCGGENPRIRSPKQTRQNKGNSTKSGKDFERRRIEGPVEHALRVTDMLLQSGGFGLVVVDLGGVPLKTARRIPLTSWFRFQRAVEHTATVLFIVSPGPCTQTCATLLLKLQGEKLPATNSRYSENAHPTHVQLLDGMHVKGELLRSRLERKPVQSVTAEFSTRTG